jgi:hypothetical protein
MRDYSKISPKVWRSPRFQGLGAERAKLFYLYVLTCQHQSSAGCFRLPDAYASADLDWNQEELAGARTALVGAGLLVHDSETDEYFVPRWFKHNPGTNPKHRTGIERLISELDSDRVREAAEAEYLESRGGPLGSEPHPFDRPNGNGGHLANTPYLTGRRS